MDPMGIDAAVDNLPKIGEELVDRAQLATDAELKQVNLIIGQQINGAMVQLSNLLSAALLGLQATEGRAAADLKELRDSCDGWTATITIPPITIRLTKPRGE